MGAKLISLITLNLDREVMRKGRAPAANVILEAGGYRIDQRLIEGSYNPFATGDLDRSPDWYHELHLAIIPLEGEARFADEVEHRCIRNAIEPGPHPDQATARDAFRAISPEERSFTLTHRSSVTLWIQAGEYGDWMKSRYARGTMHLHICRLEA